MKITVTVKRCNYSTPTKGGFWCLLATDVGTAKGIMAWEPQTDERLSLDGDWGAFRGQKQFEFSRALPDVPDNPRARLHYCIELADGCGPSMEEAIWEARGADFPLIESGEVPRLTGDKYRAFIEAVGQLSQSEDYIEAVSYLLDLGCSWKMSEAAWKAWEGNTIGIVKNNPYRLAELPNYGFLAADKLRHRFGIGDDDPRRIRACITYCMAQKQGEGDTAVDWWELRRMFLDLIPAISPNEETAAMIRWSELIPFRETKQLATQKNHENAMEIYRYATG